MDPLRVRSSDANYARRGLRRAKPVASKLSPTACKGRLLSQCQTWDILIARKVIKQAHDYVPQLPDSTKPIPHTNVERPRIQLLKLYPPSAKGWILMGGDGSMIRAR